MLYKPFGYQVFAKQHLIDNPAAGLFQDMGLGKTATVLTAYVDLRAKRRARKLIVIAPKTVAIDTWPKEVAKWDHTKHLRVSVIMGSEKQRKEAAFKDADIYCIGKENTEWLVTLFGSKWPYDMLVIDESSAFKNHKAIRFQALQCALPFVERAVILSGTPAPKSLTDLWSQIFILDDGFRLGLTFNEYTDTYFHKENQRRDTFKLNKPHKLVEKYLGEDYYEKVIYERIGDICISMRQEDYLELPPLIQNDIIIPLSKENRRKYDQFERDQMLSIIEDLNIQSDADVDRAITAANAAALSNKLLQFTNGAVYDEDHNYHTFHNQKIDQLSEIIENANGASVMVFYNFKHDQDRIAKAFKHLKPVTLSSKKEKELSDNIDRWNAGKIQLMLAHPGSAGHGLNLQQGGHVIVWFGIPWNLEHYLQGIKRIHRLGVQQAVIVHRLLCEDTKDIDVLDSIYLKKGGQDRLLAATRAKFRTLLNQNKKIAA